MNQEHSLGITEIVLLQPKSVPKTSSGKIARAWCRKAFLGGTLKTVYRKTFRGSTSTFEIENGAASTASRKLTKQDIAAIRALSKKEILSKIKTDMAKSGAVSPEAVTESAPVITLMDSLSLSQFKGLLESQYAVRISDEYLFRESTTVGKLVEVVRLGYAPDDGDGAPADGAAPASTSIGQSQGLAGALGCPPGVVCTIL